MQDCQSARVYANRWPATVCRLVCLRMHRYETSRNRLWPAPGFRWTGYGRFPDSAESALAGSGILLNRVQPVQCHIDEAIGVGLFEFDLAI